MKQGDRVQLVNVYRLIQVCINSDKVGAFGVLNRQLSDAEVKQYPNLKGEDAWWINMEVFKQKYFVPVSCISLLSTPVMEWETGDKAVLINDDGLDKVGLRGHVGCEVYLSSKLSDSGLNVRTRLRGEQAWRVHTKEGQTWYIPVSCLSPVARDKPEQKPEHKKGENNMIVAIRILKKPTIKAMEAGEVEEIIVDATDVVCADVSAGIAFVAAQNADKVKDLKGPEIRVVATTIA